MSLERTFQQEVQDELAKHPATPAGEIGRASCRERVV